MIHHHDDLWQIKVSDHLVFVQSIKLLSMRHGLLDFRLTRLINVFMYEISLSNENELTTHDNIQYGNMRLIDN